MFHQLCKEIFEAWMNDRLQVSPEMQRAFDFRYCPEPYLLFRSQEAPITFVTTNPGRGEPFQLRAYIGTPRGPIRANATYREIASDLGHWYASPSCPISSAAKVRIRAMLDLSSGLGRTGVEQVEMVPFHSAKAANGHALDYEPLLVRYRIALTHHLTSRDLVCAMAGGLADGSGVRRKADMIGLNWPGRDHLGLTTKNGRSTSGLVFSKQDRRVRAVFYRQGGLGLPGKEHLAQIRSTLL